MSPPSAQPHTHHNGRPRFSSDIESSQSSQSSTSSSSSAPTSPSAPLLRPAAAGDEKPARPRVRQQQLRGFRIRRVKTLLIRVLCGCVLLTIATMTFALSGMQKRTTKALQKHLDSSAIWQSFPVMQNYYNGLYDLVAKADNVPENTGPMNVSKAPKPGSLKGALNDATAKFAKRAKIVPMMITTKQQSKAANKPKTPPKPLPPAVIYNPYPDYQSEQYTETWQGKHVDCTPLVTNITSVSINVKAYKGIPRGHPDAYYGSHELLGIDNDICFERRTRLGIYGLKDPEEVPRNAKEARVLYNLEWRGIDWAKIQRQCVAFNQDRYIPPPSSLGDGKEKRDNPEGERGVKKVHARTALVVRVWHMYAWMHLDYVNLRSLIAELNMQSGGEYDVHLLVHVRDERVPILTKQSVYNRVVKSTIAREFRGLVTLWNEQMMQVLYPNLGVDWRELPPHGAYRSMWMPMQYFMHKHPEYDYFWNLELDVRYTGHWYHFLEQVRQFAKRQPRRGLWERNSRFYVPSVHRSWRDFSALTALQADPSEHVWGPVRVPGVNLTRHTPTPPFERPEDDVDYTWGVGEEADLITLSPLFDPKNTTWALRDDFTGGRRGGPRSLRCTDFRGGC
ncbi:hypothetical protein DRE_06977 [Drechslerella stenobrocha 248]|uniref:Glycosyl transferase CAP10 domain-containing protein n=1 Tax=Drechslerella stenobrocha 248 TaxID=1043628 RepID=W7HVR9_9PEZI|nr:hypothetical protein DRE_06977 [Drechslerella stenobrocha 248]